MEQLLKDIQTATAAASNYIRIAKGKQDENEDVCTVSLLGEALYRLSIAADKIQEAMKMAAGSKQ